MATKAWKEGPVVLRAASLESWQGQERSGILTLSGRCPRCDADFSQQIHSSTVIVTAAADGEAAFDAVTYFPCACEEVHAGRPKTKDKGCGAYWVAQPRKNKHNDRYHLEISAQPELNAAAKLIAEESQATGKGLRTLAEKWIPGVGAIVGILGLAGVVVSKDSVAGLGWSARLLAFSLVALAVLTAAGSVILVYRAAFGWPKEVSLRTNDDVLAAVEKINSRNAQIARNVRIGAGLSVASLTALLAALGVLWLQPDPDRPVTATYDDGGREMSLCGEVVGVKDGQLQLKVTDGPRTTTESIDMTSVTELEQRAKC
ncbi:hypothetical protein [Nocardioides pyridinolyticus]